ncbi:MAG: putative replicase protein [Alehxovirus allonemorishabitans]|uniref:RNA-directed RNA polymerase n=1 Tax=Leviviridae sp. TaxID=2027243 RepID=A0ABY3SVB6_9VIRU|nr:MAG: putative replicase protein [Leviviridae sp.]
MLDKSYEEYVLGLYGSMLLDIEVNRPSLQADCRRDYKRLLSLMEHRGLPMFLVDLPAFGKHFDMCLSKGHLTRSEIAGFGGYRRSVPIPKLFKGLVRRVFHESGELRVDLDVYSLQAIRQLCTAVKKLRIECPDSSTWEHVHEFFQIDGEVLSPSLTWDGDDFDHHASARLHLGDKLACQSDPHDLFGDREASAPSTTCPGGRLSTVQSVADACVAQIGGFNPFEWKFRHGPGAVSDLKGGMYKYLFPYWPDRLEHVFPLADFAFANYADWADALESGEALPLYSKHEPPSRLLSVPKTFSGPRLIASEPVAHQWCQQSIRDFLMRRVEETVLGTCISFRSQGPNQAFALRASRTMSHSTIDLSSASDRISCWLVERLFRRSPSLLAAMHASRTRWIQQDIDKKSPKFHKLRKFTTMGSAITFPTQSIVFAIIAIGCVLFNEGLPVTYDNIRHAGRRVRVFGDDIIVPIHVHEDVVETLHHLGLKVNPSKTFCTGKFRESCGIDAYDGNDVTKVSIISVPSVSKPESVLSSVDTHNNFYNRGWFEVAKFIKRTVETLRRYAFPVKHPDSGAIGWSSGWGEYECSCKTRFNTQLQRKEVLATLPRGRVDRTPVDSSTMLLQFFTEVPRVYPKDPPQADENRLGRAALRHPLKLRWVWAPAP